MIRPIRFKTDSIYQKALFISMLSTAKPRWSNDSEEISYIKLSQTKKYSPRVTLKQRRSTKNFNILNFFTFLAAPRALARCKLRKDQSSAKTVMSGIQITWQTRAIYPQCNSTGRKQKKIWRFKMGRDNGKGIISSLSRVKYTRLNPTDS